MGFSLFGSSGSSQSDDFSGSQNQGMSDVEAGEGGIVTVGQSGGEGNRINLNLSDKGAIRRAFDFAGQALEGVRESSESALDIASEVKAREQSSEAKQLGQLVLVGLLGLGAVQLIASRKRG